MKKQKIRVLVIVAHPDDEVVCAGTLMKLQSQGAEINELILTGGGEGGDRKEREEEMRKAADFLGTRKLYFLRQEDLGLTYSKSIMFKVMKVVRKVQPQIVFMMHKDDFHPDHREAFKIGMEAVKYAATGVRPDLGGLHRTKMVLMMGGMWPIRPHLMVDVSEFAEKKMEMFALHGSQANFKAVNFERAMLTIYGYQHRTGDAVLAEPFEFCSEFPSSGLIDL